jgi:hypothetical protein
VLTKPWINSQPANSQPRNRGIFSLATAGEATSKVQGYTALPDTDTNARFNEIRPGYVRTLGIPTLTGRDFRRANAFGAPKVAVVNESALGLGRPVQSLPFQLEGHDPAVIAGASGAVGGGCLRRADYIPRQRASRIDPMRALRYEYRDVASQTGGRTSWCKRRGVIRRRVGYSPVAVFIVPGDFQLNTW